MVNSISLMRFYSKFKDFEFLLSLHAGELHKMPGEWSLF